MNRNWRAGSGAFASLLAYDRSAGVGEFYHHEPVPPPTSVNGVFLEPIAGYISSRSMHPRGLCSTGSVRPGETISFHISSHGVPYTIDIFRKGPTQRGWAGRRRSVESAGVHGPA